MVDRGAFRPQPMRARVMNTTSSKFTGMYLALFENKYRWREEEEGRAARETPPTQQYPPVCVWTPPRPAEAKITRFLRKKKSNM